MPAYADPHPLCRLLRHSRIGTGKRPATRLLGGLRRSVRRACDLVQTPFWSAGSVNERGISKIRRGHPEEKDVAAAANCEDAPD